MKKVTQLNFADSILSKYKKDLLLFEVVNELDVIDSKPNLEILDIKEVEIKTKEFHCLKCKSVVKEREDNTETLFCGKCFVWWNTQELENYKTHDQYINVKMCEKKKRK